MKANIFFRTAVFAARQDAWLGMPLKIQPLKNLRLTIGFAFAALLLIGYLCAGGYTKKIRSSGTIVPNTGVIKVTPLQAE